ncbi:MAG TPA: hypothetical protein VGO31_01710 [Microbacteriaceae bacterium]|jgi:hypothetical protein|nr:hypothetical protein [Microbacteriaceae bacterium]
MQIDKQQILNFLQQHGQADKVEQAKQKLPDQVDHEQHAGVLKELGINPQELLAGKGIPGL